MCLFNGSNEWISRDESELSNNRLGWVFEEPISLFTTRFVACSCCYCPITFEDFVVDEIMDDNFETIGFVLFFDELFTDVIVRNQNLVEAWRTKVYCPLCGMILSLSDSVIDPLNPLHSLLLGEIFSYRNEDQVVILMPSFITFGSAMELHALMQ